MEAKGFQLEFFYFHVLIITVAYIPDCNGNDFFMCLFLRYMADIMDSPELIRNVVFCGQLHHGKVGLCCLAESCSMSLF